MIESSNSRIKNIRILPLIAAASIIFLFFLSVKRPYMFGESNMQALLVLVIAGLIASQYQTHFWTIMVTVFFWSGSSFPLSGSMNIFRWVVLGLGAFLALGYYARSANKISFNYLHLLGLFTMVAAFASAMVSVSPSLTLLKALSLAALFVYASIGARSLWSRNPEPFVRKLVLMAEVLVYFSALCYAASFEVWGNPNSLGLIMGCLCWPVLLWRWILPASRQGSARRFIPLFLCAALLILSLSRASITAACLSSMFLLVGSKRYRTLLMGATLLVVILLNMFLVTPDRFQDASDAFLYKKGEHGKLLDSRGKPWERSLRTFREHPWLGVGFGAADNSADWRFNYVTLGQQTRERGSSYLTILETTGAVGALPCALLILALIGEIWRVFSWLRRTGKVNQPAVVAAAILLCGLVNAFFEDWMLAVGYYMSIIFWVIAFSLRDWMACPVWADEQPAAESLARVAAPVSLALREE
jgi:O-antigen ligase